MLLSLRIKNYVLIDSLELQPVAGLNAITGETGAGKSILLGALNLLLGQRNIGGNKLLFDSSRKCVMEAVFDARAYGLGQLLEEENIDVDPQIILRRELLPDGRSRTFVNDTPVGLEVMSRVGRRLIDIHSQHETLHLTRGEFQRWTLDGWAGHEDLRQSYQQTHTHEKTTRQAYEQIKEQRQQSDQAYVQYQLKELKEVQVVAGEEQALEKKLKHIQTHQSRAEARMRALSLLDGNENTGGLLRTLSLVGEAVDDMDTSADFSQRITTAGRDLKDLAETLRTSTDGAVLSAEEQSVLEERLDKLYELLRKHKKKDSTELLALVQELEEASVAEEGQAQEEARLAEATQVAQEKLSAAAQALSAARESACKPFAEAIEGLLRRLGMPKARFYVAQEPLPPQWDGSDKLTFFFSANQGMPPRPLSQVASGGERSRLMLAIKYLIAQKKQLPALLFDEIDTGISGEMAKVLVQMVEEMSQKHQVLVITHLPRFAAHAKSHVLIYKEQLNGRTQTKARPLDAEARIRALAEMLDGTNPSIESLHTARRLRLEASS